MNKVECPECGHGFPLVETYGDGRGCFAVCPECGGPFYTDKEVELGDSHAERVDEIHNAVFEVCRTLAEDENLEWDMHCIGEIAGFAADILTAAGKKIRYPAVVTEKSGRQYISEFHK